MKSVRIDSRPVGSGFPACIVACATPVILWFCFTFVAPRPYEIVEDDAESPNYYSARLLHEGMPVALVSPPGTPIYKLGSLIMSVSGSDLDDAQRFFDIAHLVAALATSLGLAVFCKLCLRNLPFGIAALALASVLGWPTVISYLDYFESNSFIVALGLPTLALFWSTLDDQTRPDRWKFALVGAGAGLSLASKMNFVPIALSLLPALLVRQHGAIRAGNCGWLSLGIFPASAAAVFLIATAPIFGRLPDVLLITLGRESIAPGAPGAVRTASASLSALFRASPGILLTMIGTIGVLLAVGWRRRRSPAVSDGFNHRAATLLLGLLVAGTIYALACALPGRDEGLILKNVAPSALVVPFLILYCFRLAVPDLRLHEWRPWARTNAGLLAVSLLVVLPAVQHRFERRRAFAAARTASAAVVRTRLESLRAPGTRIAYWDDSYDNLLGEISWHLTGNYEYAYERFDQVLTRRYPGYTVFRLPLVGQTVAHRALAAGQRSPMLEFLPRRGTFGTLGRTWREIFPVPYPDRSDGLLPQSVSPASISLIAFPVDQVRRLGSLPESEFLDLIADTIGPPKLWRESIGGIDWILISVSHTKGEG